MNKVHDRENVRVGMNKGLCGIGSGVGPSQVVVVDRPINVLQVIIAALRIEHRTSTVLMLIPTKTISLMLL